MIITIIMIIINKCVFEFKVLSIRIIDYEVYKKLCFLRVCFPSL